MRPDIEKNMIQAHYGEFAALLVAVFWTITALSFEFASIRVGSLAVNIIRLILGFIFLSFFTFFYRGHFFPSDAGAQNWLWLSLSGLIGFVMGDYFLFHSYVIVGSWFSMLVMTLAPALAAFFGWFLLGETMDLKNTAALLLTMGGIVLAMFGKGNGQNKLALNKPVRGIIYAFLGALGQGLGIVLSKKGIAGYNAFAGTQIRIITAIIGFSIIISLTRKWPDIRQAFSHRAGMTGIFIGSFFGPFLGVSFSLLAVSYTKTGIASAIMATVPILLIPPSILLFKRKITVQEIIGSLISIAGIVLFFL
ncbi:MAG: DMT family transporter [Bacteroidales bacterium]